MNVSANPGSEVSASRRARLVYLLGFATVVSILVVAFMLVSRMNAEEHKRRTNAALQLLAKANIRLPRGSFLVNESDNRGVKLFYWTVPGEVRLHGVQLVSDIEWFDCVRSILVQDYGESEVAGVKRISRGQWDEHDYVVDATIGVRQSDSIVSLTLFPVDRHRNIVGH